MKYADPHRCPQCRTSFMSRDGSVEVPIQCVQCGLRLQTAEAFELYKALQHADVLLERAKLVGAPPSIAQPVASGLGAPATAIATPVKPVLPKLDGGTILLALGALFVLVAGSILSLLTLGVFALPLMALVAGGIAYGADRKGLRVSTETMIAVAGLLGAITVGIPALDTTTGVMIWSLLGVGSAVALIQATKPHRNFIVPRVLAGLYLIPLSLSVAALASDSFSVDTESVRYAFLVGLAALVPALGFTYFFFKQRMNVSWQLGAGVSGVAALYCWAAAWSLLFTYPEPREVLAGTGLPLLLVAVVLALIAHGAPARFSLARSLTLSLSLLHLFMLVWLPTVNESETAATLFAFASAVGLALFKSVDWRSRGLRWGSFAPLTMALLFYLGLVIDQVSTVTDAMSLALNPEWTDRYGMVSPDWYLFGLAALAIIAYGVAALRWAEMKPVYSTARTMTVGAGAIQLPLFVAFFGPSLIVLSLSALVAALVAATVLKRINGVSLALFTLAPLLALPHDGTAAVVLALTSFAAALALWWFKKSEPEARDAALGVAILAGTLALPFAGVQADWPDKPLSFVLALCAVAGLTIATLIRMRTTVRTYSGEVAAFIVGGSAFIVAQPSANVAWVALISVVLGSVLVSVSLWDDGRAWYRWVGAALLGLAWILRLVASDVTTPEAYTAPFALALLAVGAYTLVKRSEVSSMRALSAGLSLALLPSIPWVMEDPVSLRALLLTGVAAITLFTGLYFKLKAPVLASAPILAFIAVLELGPYLLLLDRWVLIIAFGALFLFMGFTWEARVNNGREVAARLDAMR